VIKTHCITKRQKSAISSRK